MGTVSQCESKFNINSSGNEINSKKKFIIHRQIATDNISNIKNNKSYEYFLKNKNAFNNLSPKIKGISDSYNKNSSNKNKTSSYISLTTNNNFKSKINSKRINTSDNTKHITITISDEETIDNQNSIDFSNSFELNNLKYNKIINLKKKFVTKKEVRKRNLNINIINEENEEELTKKNNTKKTDVNKINKNKELFLFSYDSESLLIKKDKLNNIYYSNLSPQLTINKYYYNKQKDSNKKTSNISSKSNLISTQKKQPQKTIYKKIRKNKKIVKLNLDENIINDNLEDNNYYLSGFNPVHKCPSYKNENKIIKKLKMTKKNQENQIKSLKNKVNNLYNIIENNKIKESKLISDLKKEKIKNENIIRKLKIELIKEKNEIQYNIYKKYTNEKKLSNNNSLMVKGNINHLKTDFYINCNKKEQKNEIIPNIIYCKKYRKNSDFLKHTILRKKIPIKINIDLFDNDSEKNIKIINTDSNVNNKKHNNYLKNENKIYVRLKQNKSDFEENKDKINNERKNNNDKFNNLVYVPKKSNISKKFVIFGNKRRSKSITNPNDIKIKLKNNNNINNNMIDEKKDIKKKNLETLSLTDTNFIYESLNKKGEISMNLNLSPIIKKNSKKKIQSIEESPISDLFKTKKIIDNNNMDKQNFIYKNKLKFEINDTGHKNNKKSSLSPQEKNSNKQKNYFYSRNCPNLLKISFIFLQEKIDLILNQNNSFPQIIKELINKINENKTKYQKFSLIHENKDKLIFIYNNIMLDKNKSLEENNVSNNSIIFIFLGK